MPVTSQDVQKLREATQAGILDCKNALEASDGDFEKAIQFLREKGKAQAAKKAGRSASEGLIAIWLDEAESRGSIVEMNCETDFVARTDEFENFVRDLARIAGETKTDSAATLASAKMGSETVESAVKEKIGKLGENMKLKRAIAIGGAGKVIASYVHSPSANVPVCGKLAVLVELSGPASPITKEIGKELAMQIAAAMPKWVQKEDVPKEIVDKELAIYKEQCKAMNKPEAAWPKIMDGKLADFYRQFCLVQQSHIRDSSGKTPVESVLKEASQKAGGEIKVNRFLRFKVGEEA